MASTLFVTNQDVPDRGVEDGIVCGQDRTARNTEHHINASGFKAFHQ
jgi:hypothetical protein